MALAMIDEAVEAEVEVEARMAKGPAWLCDAELEEQIRIQVTQLDAAQCRWLLLVAEYDRRRAWEKWETRSCAQWLEWHCQISPVTAREHVRVARALDDLPATTQAFARGEVSYSKVRAITRVADTDSEAELLDLAAAMSASQLDRTVRALEKAMVSVSQDDLARQHAKRAADRWEDDDGTVVWVLRMTPEEDAGVQHGIEWAREQDYQAARAENKAAAEAAGTKAEPVGPGRGQRLPRLDALLALFEAGLATAAHADGMLPERYQVMLHTAGARIDDDGFLRLEDGIRLHPKTARRLGCDASVRVIESVPGADELRLGRRVRLFTDKQRAAILQRYPMCGFPNCDIPGKWTQMHHVEHWIDGGPTDLENGVPLCKKHHNALHEGGWNLVIGSGGDVIAAGPEGQVVTRVPEHFPVPDSFELAALHRRLGVEVNVNHHQPYERGSLRDAIDCLIYNWDVRRRRLADDDIAGGFCPGAVGPFDNPPAGMNRSHQRPDLN